MTIRLSERVRAGVAFLDETVPDWRDRVDPDTLAMNSGDLCVLGQVFAKEASQESDTRNGFLYAIERYGNWNKPESGDPVHWQVENGFAYLGGSWSWFAEDKALRRAWKLVLAA